MTRQYPPPAHSVGMGLGDLILREVACSQTSHRHVNKQAPTMQATTKLKVCKVRQHVKRINPQKADQQARETAARAIAALSVSWAPGAGIAKGFPPTSREAIEIAYIKQEEWTEYEPRRLWQAKNAWASWAKFAESRGYPDSRDAPSNLVIVWLNSSGSHSQASNMYRHMKFMVTKAAAPLALDEYMRPISVAVHNPADRKQAVVAEPAMLQYLEHQIHMHAQRKDWKTPTLCVAFIMATSVLRFAHTGRSSFFIQKEGGWWCRCHKGKSKAENGKRRGFLWFAPDVTLIGASTTPLQILYRMWDEVSQAAPRGEPLSYLAFEYPTGTQVLYTRFQDILREVLAPTVHTSQSLLVTTYSMRRVGATLTRLLELDSNNEYAVGGWTAPGASKEANDIRRGMPNVYNNRRATMEEMAKMALWATTIILLAETAAYTSSPTWEDLHVAASKVTPSGRHASVVYLREMHKATILTKVHPKGTAYGIDPQVVIEKRFKVTGARVRALSTTPPKRLKRESLKEEIKQEPGMNPIIQDFMRNQELDSMLRAGAAEAGPLQSAFGTVPTTLCGPHTTRPPKRNRQSCTEGCRCVGGCYSTFCCGGTRSCCRGKRVHGERHYCLVCITGQGDTAHIRGFF